MPATQLSEAVGAARDLVRQIEVGVIANPGADVMGRIALALDVPLDWLINGIGELVEEKVAAAGARVVAVARLRRPRRSAA